MYQSILSLESAVIADIQTAESALGLEGMREGVLATAADTIPLLVDLAVTFKHPKYRFDKEWRLVRIDLSSDSGHLDRVIEESPPQPYVDTKLRIHTQASSYFPVDGILRGEYAIEIPEYDDTGFISAEDENMYNRGKLPNGTVYLSGDDVLYGA